MLFKKSSLAVAASLLAIGNAYAATATANVPVNINAVISNPATCTLSVNGYTAPSYTSGATSSITTVISGLVSCSGSSIPVSFALSADAGQNASGGTRKAVSGTTNFINYTLLQGTGTSTTQLDAVPNVFGGSPQNGTTVVTGTTSASTYGFRMVVPANQTVAAGSYADTVVLTATY
jgi:spore coat protein U-like protein